MARMAFVLTHLRRLSSALPENFALLPRARQDWRLLNKQLFLWLFLWLLHLLLPLHRPVNAILRVLVVGKASMWG
jgi:hypothetical protein